MAIYKFEDLLKKTGTKAEDVKSLGIAEKPEDADSGYSFGELGQDISQVGSDIKSSYLKRQDSLREDKRAQDAGEQGGVRTFLHVLGQGAGLVSDTIGAGFKGAVKAVLPQSAETSISGGIQSFGKLVSENKDVQGIVNMYNSLDPQIQRDLSAALGVGSLALDVATMGGGKKVAEVGAKKVIDVVGKSVEASKSLVGDAVDLTKRVTGKVIEKAGTPKLTALEATGQVLQGTTKDIGAGVKALSTLETTGVKTFGQLEETIGKKITQLSLQVDKDLGVDTTKTMLKDLVTTAKTTAGKIIKSNPVQTALKHLEELYTKIGDKVEAANIRELIQSASKKGLTRQEINNIARVYGEKFSEKAFGKLGEPLTTVNAQLYENTRRAVKDVARQGIKGAAAKKADALISSLYRTKTLVNKSVELVNKLSQRINERGLFEKVGHAVAKYGDILTGGSLRGFVGGLLPRGAGYKVLNALDIERALESNLKIIQNAIKAKDNAEIVRILKGLIKQ